MSSPLFSIYEVVSGTSDFSGRKGLCVRFARRGDEGRGKLVTVAELVKFLKFELACEPETPPASRSSRPAKPDAA